MVKIKRVYLPAEEADGYRILVDRLWPRGISKEDAKIDLWDKDVALANLKKAVREHDVVTLLFSARDEEHNNAVVLKELISSSNGQG